jgi:cytochrome o ubiquinol oxidase operon protein cyoD
MKSSSSLAQDFASYGIGYLLAVLLTGAAFACVFFRLLPESETFIFVLFLAFVQICVHLRCFLHISLKPSARADLILLLFSTVIIALIVVGTLVILFDERARMMNMTM